jgi:aquaporin Z
MKKYFAECLWTMILVLFWCWVAVRTWVDVISTAFAFGLVIVALAYAIGPVSGCHINPAVSLWIWLTGKMKTKDFYWYVVAQFIGGIIWAALLWILLNDFSILWSNSLDGVFWNIWLGLLAEIILTFVFVYTVLGVTSKEKYSTIAGLVIGW